MMMPKYCLSDDVIAIIFRSDVSALYIAHSFICLVEKTKITLSRVGSKKRQLHALLHIWLTVILLLLL